MWWHRAADGNSHAPDRDPGVRVCHVAMGDLWAGAEVQLLTLMTSLVRLQGFEWSVILFNEGRLADELRKLPLVLIVIPEENYSSIGIAARLADCFRRLRPDIVHTHKYKDSILGAVVARWMGVARVVRMVHGMPESFRAFGNAKMACYTIAERFVNGWLVDKMVAVSFDIERTLLRRYVSNHVICIHNGIDLDAVRVTMQRADMRKKWHVNEKAILIGTAGRLVSVKGHTVLLKAFQILRERHDNLTLFVVGDGPLRGHLEAEAHRLGIGQSVVFVGHQDQAYNFINMMDIFAIPSLHEGIPMVLLEAFALRRPVIASRVGGIPEVVSHGQSGLLVKPADVGELAEGINAMIEDQSKTLAFGIAGRSRVECEFSANTMADRTVAMYQSL